MSDKEIPIVRLQDFLSGPQHTHTPEHTYMILAPQNPRFESLVSLQRHQLVCRGCEAGRCRDHCQSCGSYYHCHHR